MIKEPHRCDERCVCPIHETPMLYAPSINDHACQDVDCRYGHGMRSENARMVDGEWTFTPEGHSMFTYGPHRQPGTMNAEICGDQLPSEAKEQ